MNDKDIAKKPGSKNMPDPLSKKRSFLNDGSFFCLKCHKTFHMSARRKFEKQGVWPFLQRLQLYIIMDPDLYMWKLATLSNLPKGTH